nr:hypothetical protein GCM10020092_032450 [Actinoplanes digitatis]
MSELGTGTRTLAGDDPMVAARTIGRPGTGSELRIRDSGGNSAGVGVAGELQYRGPNLFRGYYGDPELTAAAITDDGWLRTGDTAAVDVDGRIVFHGRAAEIINVGGRKVSAVEVQSLLADLPGIGPQAVVGQADPRLGEFPVLVVTEAARGRIDLAEVTGFLRGLGLADYKIPLDLVFLPDLPRTPAGKLHRRALEDLLRERPHRPAAYAGSLQEALDLVRACVAQVGEGADIGPQDSFRSRGLDSIRTIRLRNAIAEAIGMSLPATLAFDHPTPLAVARHLVGQDDDDPVPSAGRRHRGTDRDRRHGLPAARRRDLPGRALGAGRRAAWTRSPVSRGTAAGTSTRCSTTTRTTPAPRTPGRAASCTTQPASTPGSSASPRARPWRPTRSTG